MEHYEPLPRRVCRAPARQLPLPLPPSPPLPGFSQSPCLRLAAVTFITLPCAFNLALTFVLQHRRGRGGRAGRRRQPGWRRAAAPGAAGQRGVDLGGRGEPGPVLHAHLQAGGQTLSFGLADCCGNELRYCTGPIALLSLPCSGVAQCVLLTLVLLPCPVCCLLVSHQPRCRYWEGKGFAVILTARLLNLLALAFTGAVGLQGQGGSGSCRSKIASERVVCSKSNNISSSSCFLSVHGMPVILSFSCHLPTNRLLCASSSTAAAGMSALLLLYVNWGALQAECLRKDTCDIWEVSVWLQCFPGRCLCCWFFCCLHSEGWHGCASMRCGLQRQPALFDAATAADTPSFLPPLSVATGGYPAAPAGGRPHALEFPGGRLPHLVCSLLARGCGAWVGIANAVLLACAVMHFVQPALASANQAQGLVTAGQCMRSCRHPAFVRGAN